MRWPTAALIAILVGGLAAFALLELGRDGGRTESADGAGAGAETRDPAPTELDRPREPSRESPPPPRDATCPAELDSCRAASGRIVYIEDVDPDGDGDAHFVLASTDSVTAPGITVVDVGAHLRPEPLPGVGERISAAGHVFPGSYGQRQIEAVELHIAAR